MSEWQPIETAPKDRIILVYYDHKADPYQDPRNPSKLTDYACHAEGGDFLNWKGVAIAKWSYGWHEDNGWESGQEWWMPAAWFAWFNDDYADHVCNPTHWMPLPASPAQAIEARSAMTAGHGPKDESAVACDAPKGDQ